MLLPYSDITLHFISCYNIDISENQRSLSYCIFSNKFSINNTIQLSLRGNIQFLPQLSLICYETLHIFFRIHGQVAFICYMSFVTRENSKEKL